MELDRCLGNIDCICGNLLVNNRRAVWGFMVILVLLFQRLPKCFPECLYHFISLLAMC